MTEGSRPVTDAEFVQARGRFGSALQAAFSEFERVMRFAAGTLSCVLLACAQPGLEARVQALEVAADREAVIQLIHAYAHGIDSMDEALLGRTFAEDAVAEYKGVNFPMDLRLEGFDAILAWLRSSVGHRESALPWHFMSTHLVEIEGDRASLRTFQHNRHLSGVGLYTVKARRTEDGWRIEELRLEERILDPDLLERLNTRPTS
ncbi:MAG: nuclear transport factor 2 family protein [Deltaproteobacteria bacterium]|nr:nuclear transport factor 2 family protein [Deltaproteobacteria bacterium]